MNENIKIGYEFFEKTSTLDPARIEDIFQSNLIENLFSRIVEFDTNNNLVCVLCEKFWVEDRKLYIKFKNKLTSSSGEKIGARDALETLKRLLALNTNTHGNLNLFIDVNDEQSLTIEEEVLVIKMQSAHFSQFLLPLLASMDYSIIPIGSIDHFKIHGVLDMKNTSGPYSVESDLGNGEIVIKANKKHPLFEEGMPEGIELVPITYGEGVDKFLSNEIDLLDVTYYPGLPQYEKLFSQKNKKFNSHKTSLINVFLLNFSSESSNDFSPEQKFYVARIISEKILSFKKYGYGFEQVLEFFQANGTGHLSEDQFLELKKLREVNQKPIFSKPITFGVHKDSYVKISEALKDNPEILVKEFSRNPGTYPLSQRPDVFLQTTDSSFNEDVSLMSYNISLEFFGMSKARGEEWLKSFIEISDKKERIKKLQLLQLELLTKPILYPIGASPYWAIAREDLEINFSKYFPGSSWWKVRKK